MSSNPYVPTPQEMREYVVSGGEYRPWAPPGDRAETARGEAFDRFIAKVRADALRAAQAIFEKGHPAKWDAGMVSCVLGARAARHEDEARGKRDGC